MLPGEVRINGKSSKKTGFFKKHNIRPLELDRFIPVKSDENIIFTCFLEYEPERVKVHDIVYKKNNGEWNLNKSFFRKLRLSKDWVVGELPAIGFKQIEATVDNGFVTVIAEN